MLTEENDPLIPLCIAPRSCCMLTPLSSCVLTETDFVMPSFFSNHDIEQSPHLNNTPRMKCGCITAVVFANSNRDGVMSHESEDTFFCPGLAALRTKNPRNSIGPSLNCRFYRVEELETSMTTTLFTATFFFLTIVGAVGKCSRPQEN